MMYGFSLILASFFSNSFLDFLSFSSVNGMGAMLITERGGVNNNAAPVGDLVGQSHRRAACVKLNHRVKAM